MVDYNIVKHCKMCGIRFVVPKAEAKKWYCDKCYNQALEQATDTDYSCDIRSHPFLGCGKEVDGKFCGYTHLGYSWCDECKQLDRLVECVHYSYECVGTIVEGEQEGNCLENNCSRTARW